MKLRNKKTGETGYLYANKNENYNVLDENGKVLAVYETLKAVVEKWEDYEEPKEFWFVDSAGEAQDTTYVTDSDKTNLRNFGNYFETKEEAEKAVEKLKAWKRLKDKGFKFIGVRGIGKVIDFDIPEPYNHVGFDEYVASKDEIEFYDDLLLLFGSEE